MSPTPRRLLVLFSALAVPLAAEPASPAPSADSVLAIVRKVNGRFMAEHPDPSQPIPIRGSLRPSNIWTRAVYYEGLMALYRADPDPAYLDYAVRWGQCHHWDLNRGTASGSADNQCCGQTYLALYALDPQPERIRSLEANVSAMLAQPSTNDWWWCDSLQMAMPVFARLGVLRNDPRYLEKMYALYTDSRDRQGGHGLYNPVDHLWWRDRNFLPPYHEPNGRNAYWARGNGWVFAGLARVLEILPPQAAHRDAYLRDFQEMAAALLPLQRSDGYWNVSLLDPTHFGGPEVTGTSLFVYGYAAGIRLGLLPEHPYRVSLLRAWDAMATGAVHPNGFLGYIQGTGRQPSDSQPVGYDHIPDTDDFGIGCFLLAGSEVYRMAKGPGPAVFLDPKRENPAALAQSLRRDLDRPLETIVDKPAPSPTGNPHDYVSFARYWWPDPARPDGLPFLRHDGRVNQRQIALGDEDRLLRMQDTVNQLALGWAVLHRRDCAERAATWLRTWFIDPSTRMNPQLEFSQIQLGHRQNHGNPTGILDGRNFAETVDAIRLLDGSGALSPADQAALRAWFHAYLGWLLNSANGQGEHAAPNNHGSWYLVQAVAIALFDGQRDTARALCLEDKRRVDSQIDPDGKQPLELAREDGLGYSVFNLQAQLKVVRLAASVGVDLADYKGPRGGSLRKAFDYVRPYALNPKSWPGHQLNPPDKRFFDPVAEEAARLGWE